MYILCKYKNTWLTPLKLSRANRLRSRHEARIVKDKFTGKLICVLLREPSKTIESKLPIYTAGFDLGKNFNNITIKSKRDQISYQYNTESDHIKLIQENNSHKVSIRKLRRSRLRHRKCRFNNRTGSKMSKTTNYYYQLRYRICKRFHDRYHYNIINIEYPKVTYSASFQYLLQGKTRLHRDLYKLGVHINEISGLLTSKLRKSRLGEPIYGEQIYDEDLHEYTDKRFIEGFTDPKDYNKENLNWFTHSIDSFILATLANNHKPLHYKTIFAEQNYSFRKDGKLIRPKHRFPRMMARVVGSNRHYHKLHKVRVKINNTKSNHGPWSYEYNDGHSDLGYNPNFRMESGYTDYLGRYYNLIGNKPTCKFRNPSDGKYYYEKIQVI